MARFYFLKYIKAILILFCSLILRTSFGQTNATAFELIDKRVKSIPASSPDTLTKKLTAFCKNEREKARAIFKWITGNIVYDTDGYHNVEKIYDGLWRPDISLDDSAIQKDYHDRIVQKVLKEKKAICDGYSRLFKSLCDNAGIKSVIITGFIRWSSDPIGVATNREHAWNAVFIDNAWRLIDATWASGYCNAGVTEFTKFYDDFFFFTDPIHFFNDHYPSDNRWSLMPVTPSLYQFYSFPFYYPTFYKSKIISLKPTTGHIEVADRNKRVIIEIETTGVTKDMYVYETPYAEDPATSSVKTDSLSEKEFEELYKPKYHINGGKVTYVYDILSGNAEKLHVMYNDKLILTYGLRIIKQPRNDNH